MGIDTPERCRADAWRGTTPAQARLWLAVVVVVAVVAAFFVSPAPAADTGSRPDRWHAWLADESTCPGGGSMSAPRGVQVRAMLCLVNYARARQGLRPLTPSPILTASSAEKAADIARCHDFGHDACGKRAAQAARALGHRGPWQENLYVGKGSLASPRAAVDAWLDSPGHRATLFDPDLRSAGIARLADATVSLGGQTLSDAVVWVHQFGA